MKEMKYPKKNHKVEKSSARIVTTQLRTCFSCEL